MNKKNKKKRLTKKQKVMLILDIIAIIISVYMFIGFFQLIDSWLFEFNLVLHLVLGVVVCSLVMAIGVVYVRWKPDEDKEED